MKIPVRSSAWRTWSAYAVMITPNAAVGLTLAALPPVLPELAHSLGSERSAQIITSIAGFGMIFGGFFSGRLLERFGLRAFTVTSLLIYAVFGSLGWFLTSAITLGASRFVLGIGGVFFSTAALALTAERFSGEARSRIIGLQQATSQIVNICAVFMVGALVSLTGWRGAFLLYGLFGALLFVLAAMGIPPSRGRSHSRAAACTTTRDGFLIRITPICALTTLMGILTVIPMTQLPFAMARMDLGAPPHVSLVLGIGFLMAAISATSFSHLALRLTKKWTFMLGLTVGMIGISMMSLSKGLPIVCLAAGFAGFGTGICNTYVFDHGVDISPPSHHGRAAGLLFAFMFFGAAINPLCLGLFEEALGLQDMFTAVAALSWLFSLPVVIARDRATSAQDVRPESRKQV